MSQVTSYKSCFQVVKPILDKLYLQITPQNHSDKNKAIIQALISLREKYPLLREGQVMTYSSPSTRFAYLYRYVVSHANAIYRIIEQSSDLSEIFDSNETYISCLGGGSGTDFLGISKFVASNSRSCTLRCDIYDREEGWRSVWGDLCDELRSTFFIVPSLQQMEIGNSYAQVDGSDFSRTNLFTMSFFLSELCSFQEQTEMFFHNVFEQAQYGAMFLFVENQQRYASNLFDAMIENYNCSRESSTLELLRSENKYTFKLSFDEAVEYIEPYYGMFRRVEHPVMHACVD